MLGLLTRKKVMGIDASTNSLAFSIFKGKRLVRWGIVYFEGRDLTERLVDIRKKLMALDLPKVDVIYMERAIYVQNKVSFAALAAAFGVVRSVLGDKARFEEIPPTTWYRYIGNSGLSKPAQVQFKKDNPGKSVAWYKTQFREERKNITKRWVTNSYGIVINDDNITDAIAIGACGLDLIKGK